MKEKQCQANQSINTVLSIINELHESRDYLLLTRKAILKADNITVVQLTLANFTLLLRDSRNPRSNPRK